jgi:hypothetical protein
VLTGQALGESPTKQFFRSTDVPSGPSMMDVGLAAGEPVLLFWFSSSSRDDLFTLDELRDRYSLTQATALADGAVYAVRTRDR